MPTLNINGQRVKVGENFLSLSPEQQQATVEEIAQSLGSKPEGAASKDFRAFASNATNNPGDAVYDQMSGLEKVARTADDFVRGAADTITFGFADELAAWLNGGDYEKNLTAERARDEQGGYARLAGQVGGAVMMPGAASKTVGRAAMKGAGAGAVYGFGSGEGNVEDRLDDAAFGAGAGGVAGAALKGVTNALGNRAAAKTIPENEGIRRAANAAYNRAEAAGVVFRPEGVRRLAQSIVDDLAEFGFDPALQPGVMATLQRFKAMDGKNVTLKGLDVLRRVAGSAAKVVGNPSQSTISAKIIDRIDDFIEGATDADVLIGNAKVGAGALAEGRKLWGQLRKSQMVDTAALKAERRADSTGKGTNADNAMRQNIRGLLDNPKTARGMTKAETAAAERVVRGTGTQNALRRVGALAPTGVVSGGIGSSLGASLGAWLGGGPIGAGIGAVMLPAVGQAAKSMADRGTMKNVQRLSQIIRSGGRTGKDLADLARGGQLQIDQVTRLENFAKRIGISVPEMAAMLQQRAVSAFEE